MHSRRVLGAIALSAVVVAAISFGVVDVSIADANGCVGVSSVCLDHTVPPVAITFAALGVLALLVSILPMVKWIIEAVHVGRMSDHDVAQEEAVLARRRTRALVGDDRF